ncbi:MAG TPA: N-acetyltransferase, partial [Anaerolineae bacterium]|nr:N-acetyltransferase [Anaerolineae bacterium]
TLAWIQRLQASYERCEDFAWGVTQKDSGQIIGVCTLWNFDPSFHCAEIGYELNPLYQKQGIMSEAISAVLTFGFTTLGLHRIEANPSAENMASINLLRKFGFKQEGILRERIYFRGRLDDQMYFGLLRDEWLYPSNT